MGPASTSLLLRRTSSFCCVSSPGLGDNISLVPTWPGNEASDNIRYYCGIVKCWTSDGLQVHVAS